MSVSSSVEPRASVAAAAGRMLMSIGVFTALAVAAWYGHSTGWRLPKFSELFGTGGAEAAWCEEHSVLEAECIECVPSLIPPVTDLGWCKIHGVPNCPWEHPEAAQTKESITPTPEQFAAAKRALDLSPRPENNPLCNLHQRRIQFASIEAAEKAGIDIAIVDTAPIVEAISANGEVVYDQSRLAQMSSRTAGTVTRVFKQTGDRVVRGEILALIDSVEVGKAKADFLQALAHDRLVHATLERLRPLAARGDVPERQFREAENADEEAHITLLASRQVLANLGLTVDQEALSRLSIDDAAAQLQRLGLDEVAGSLSGPTSNLFPVRSPLDGLVVARKAVDGEAVDIGASLLTVADVSRMWLLVDVRQDDVERLVPGLPVRFTPSGARPTPVLGSIAWISTEADERTRTVKVRVELPNDPTRLRANTFGTAQILLREEPTAVVVSSEAVHWEGCCHVVFVRDKNWFVEGGPKFFHVRKVRLGVNENGKTEIIAGLLPDEVIAVKGSLVLASQLLKAKLGAGCGCAH